MPFLPLFEIFASVILPVFGIVLLGFFFGKKCNIEAAISSRLAYYFLLPAFVFDIFHKSKTGISEILPYILPLCLSQLAIMLVAFLWSKYALASNKQQTTAQCLSAVFPNTGNFGFPLILFHFGQAALLPAAISFLVLFLFAMTLSVFIASSAQSSKAASFLAILKTPGIIAAIPALLINEFSLELPVFIERGSGLLGAALIPVALITLGIQLSHEGKPEFNAEVASMVVMRLVAAPVLAFFVLRFFVDDELGAAVSLVQTAMPIAILTLMISMEYKLPTKDLSASILLSTFLSTLSLTFLLSLV